MPEIVVPTFRLSAPDAPDWSKVQRVLVVKLRHHGDVLLTSPVFSALKIHAPHVQVDALVYDDTAPLLQHHPDIHTLHVIGRQWRKAGRLRQFLCEWRLLRALRTRRYDVLIHLTDSRRGAWLVRALGVKVSVAPTSRKRGWKNRFTHLFTLAGGNRRHTVEYHLDALRRIGIHPGQDARALTLVPGASATDDIAQCLAAHQLMPQQFIHFHAASRWLFKCWPIEKTAALIDQFTAAGWPVVLTGAPDPAERALNAAIVARLSRPIVDLTGKTSLLGLAALTAQARLFVGVDSAPMHIAAAMQTPTVALFGPSGEIEWAPWRVANRVLVSSHPCRPCGKDGCGGGKLSECLEVIEVAQVWQACQPWITPAV